MKFKKVVCLTVVCALFLCYSSASYGTEPKTTCAASLLYEVNSSQLLYKDNAYEKAYPASLTKVMTALLAVENCSLDETVTVSKSALDAVPPSSSVSGLKNGEIMSLENVLKCLLVPSGNDAANVIAEHVSGSISEFVNLMNTRAEELGCTNTSFKNPSGYHDDEHYTCAYDLLLITLEAMKHPEITEICASSQVTIPADNAYDEERIYNNTNYLLNRAKSGQYIYEYATGFKTGSTTPAGQCLIATAKKDSLSLVTVVLGGEKTVTAVGTDRITSYVDTRALFQWGFKYFNFREIVSLTDVLAEAKVDMAADKDYVVLTPDKSIKALMYKTDTSDDVQIVTEVDEGITAPIKQGEILGTARVSFNGDEYGKVNLVAMNDVDISEVLYYFSEVEKFFAQKWVKYVILGLALLIVILIIYTIIYNNGRRRRSIRRRRY